MLALSLASSYDAKLILPHARTPLYFYISSLSELFLPSMVLVVAD